MRKFMMIALVAALPFAAQAQDKPAILVADELYITQDRVLVAQGNVEAFQNGVRLQARTIRYDQTSGSLTIEGPIVISEGTDTVILADAAQLDEGLREGLLQSARLVLNQRLQLAAAQINRVEGRYSQLYKTSVTSCHVCGNGEAPLWQIRAERVIHDQVEKQLYFDKAQFRIRDVPVFYLPRLRLPDPTQDRATGFLIPSIRTTTLLGTGLKIPYFIKIGDYKDLTLTPYLSSATTTLELRYRQAFRNGSLEVNGALTKDDLDDSDRGYVFAEGSFDLPRNYTLRLAVQSASDESYLKDYSYSDADRLKSELTIERVTRDEYVRGSLVNFQSLRDGEVNETLPTIILDGEYERRIFTQAVPGELRLNLQAHTHRRISALDVDGPDPDDIVDGRDVSRLNGTAEWLGSTTLGAGLRVEGKAGASFSVFDITQDATYAQTHTEIAPHATVALRYPMARQTANGVSQVLEPIAQLAWRGGSRLAIPNEESTRVEFDEGNLLSLSRFTQVDRRERGAVAAVGLNWARFDPNGWDTYLSVGQVFRGDADSDFTASSGLSGTSSDILVAGQISIESGLAFAARGLFDSNLDFAKAELRGNWVFKKGRLGGSYVWLEADADEDRDDPVSEIALDGAYKINDTWTAAASWRYDIESDRASTAGLGLTYENECVSLDLTVERSYSSSTSVEPSTNIGFNIGLRGFAADTGIERYQRSCGN
ncbi:MAG: LPS-assembly protein LptD [Sulfitobacter sp.]